MKYFLSRTMMLLLLAAASVLPPSRAFAADKTVDLAGGKAVIFNLPAGWEIVPGEAPPELANLGKTIKLSPKNGANAECDITLLLTPDSRFADHAVLKDLLISSSDSLVGDSLEGKVNAVEFKTPHGFGYLATFTDKNLVGKPSEKGNYKAVTLVMIYLPEQIAITATILCDDVAGPDFATLQALLRSLGAHSKSNSI
jgi:hypothetical protein